MVCILRPLLFTLAISHQGHYSEQCLANVVCLDQESNTSDL